MTFLHALSWVDHLLRRELFPVAGVSVTTLSLLTAIVLVLASVRLSRFVRAAMLRTLDRRGVDDAGTRALMTRATHYLLMSIGIGIALQTVGFDLGSLFAAGAFFAVGIGFAMQNIAQNFVSGIILLLERSIRTGDILRVDGHIVHVESMGIRSTVVRSLDDEQLIVPNGILGQSIVTNFTFQDRRVRVRAQVGVHYDSDMTQVQQVLQEVAEAFGGAEPVRAPMVLLKGFGSSSVDWEVSVWTEDPWAIEPTASRLRLAVWQAFKEADIVIAYPQVDVHFDAGAPPALAAAR